MNKKIQLTVNANAVSAEVEPRLQLADFLREHLLLTGTHLGCEHGVCGACTVQIDGAPARACIAYAVACDGADVRTIEGFDGDPVMADLREAFSGEHALQCGYCTPGMLITARDIVLRVPDADEARIRRELSGNLCRCTGYVGIVRAIQRVIAERRARGESDFVRPEITAGRKDERSPGRVPEIAAVRPEAGVMRSVSSVRPSTRTSLSAQERQQPPQTTLHQSFTVEHPRDKVWEFFGRLGDVTLCLPGTSLIGTPGDDHVETRIRMKVGPIVPEFEGTADAVRDASNYSGRIHGSARDARSSSATHGEIRYRLIEEKNGAATRVDVDVGFTLTGPLAQFSRSSIVQDIAKRMTAAFAQNLEARLNQGQRGSYAEAKAPTQAAEIDAGSLVLSVLWSRIRTFFRSLFGR
jgi:carbon-monoxide dehydrogenase small subunit